MKKQAGIGLIEILISVLLIAVGVAGIVSLQKHMRQKSAEAEEFLIATQQAQGMSEKLRTFAAGGISGIAVSESVTTTVNGITYTALRKASTDSGIVGDISTDNGLKDVALEVKWSSLDQKDKTLDFDVLVSPISGFSSDEFISGGGGNGSVSGPDLIRAQNPSDPAHSPPVYDNTQNYYDNEQVTYNNQKYVCMIGVYCSDHSTYSPTSTTVWKECTGGTCPAKCTRGSCT